MPTIDTLEMMRRLCDDPLMCEHEAEAGAVLEVEEDEEGEQADEPDPSRATPAPL